MQIASESDFVSTLRDIYLSDMVEFLIDNWLHPWKWEEENLQNSGNPGVATSPWREVRGRRDWSLKVPFARIPGDLVLSSPPSPSSWPDHHNFEVPFARIPGDLFYYHPHHPYHPHRPHHPQQHHHHAQHTFYPKLEYSLKVDTPVEETATTITVIIITIINYIFARSSTIFPPGGHGRGGDCHGDWFAADMWTILRR